MTVPLRRWIPGFLIAVAFAAACDDDGGLFTIDDDVSNTNFSASEPISVDVQVTSQTRLALEGINGTVEIVGDLDATTVSVRGERRVESESTADARASLPDLQVVVTETGSQVAVRTEQPRNTGGRNFVVDYQITVPEDLRIVVANINGSVEVSFIRNDVTVANVNGQVALDGIVGSTAVGLVNGLILASVTPPVDGEVDLATVNGSLDLTIPASTTAELTATVTNGNITVDGLALSNQTVTATSIAGTLGDGRGVIELTTVNGNISVRGS